MVGGRGEDICIGDGSGTTGERVVNAREFGSFDGDAGQYPRIREGGFVPIDLSVPLLCGEGTRGGKAGVTLGGDLAAQGLFVMGRVPGEQPVDKGGAVNGPLGQLVRCQKHQELVWGGRPEGISEGANMCGRGLLQLVGRIRWGCCQVRDQVTHRYLVRTPVEVGVPLLQRANVQRRQGFDRDSPEQAERPKHSIAGLKGLHRRSRLVMSDCELQLPGGLAPAHSRRRPRLRKANVGRALGWGFAGEGMLGRHGLHVESERRGVTGTGAGGREGRGQKEGTDRYLGDRAGAREPGWWGQGHTDRGHVGTRAVAYGLGHSWTG